MSLLHEGLEEGLGSQRMRLKTVQNDAHNLHSVLTTQLQAHLVLSSYLLFCNDAMMCADYEDKSAANLPGSHKRKTSFHSTCGNTMFFNSMTLMFLNPKFHWLNFLKCVVHSFHARMLCSLLMSFCFTSESGPQQANKSTKKPR